MFELMLAKYIWEKIRKHKNMSIERFSVCIFSSVMLQNILYDGFSKF